MGVDAIIRTQTPSFDHVPRLAGLLHLVTSPVGSNLLARATCSAECIGHGIDTTDELAELRVSDEAEDEQPPGPAGRHGVS